jgi:hypothetical protein
LLLSHWMPRSTLLNSCFCFRTSSSSFFTVKIAVLSLLLMPM